MVKWSKVRSLLPLILLNKTQIFVYGKVGPWALVEGGMLDIKSIYVSLPNSLSFWERWFMTKFKLSLETMSCLQVKLC